MVYSYYDWLRDEYYGDLEEYYEEYYEYYYWPKYYEVYNISNDSWCDFIHQYNHSELESSFNITGTEAPFLITSTYMDTTLYSTAFDTTRTPSDMNATLFNCTPRYNGTFPPSLYEWEQWWDDSIDTIGLVQVPISTTIATCCCAMMILFFVKLKAALHQKNANRPNRLTVVLAVICMISHSIYAWGDMFLYYFWYYEYDRTHYFYTECVWEVFWLMGKVSIYSLFAYRYYMLQDASLHNPLGAKKQRLLFATIIGGILIQIVLECLYAVYRFDYLTADLYDEGYAQKRRIYLNAAWAVMAIDFVLVLFLGVCIMATILRLVLAMHDPDRVMKFTASKHGLTEASKSKPSQFSVTSGSVGTAQVEMSGTAADDRNKETQDAMKKQTSKFKFLSELSRRATHTMSEERQKRTSTQMNLMEVTTRIALTCGVSLVSSFAVQLSSYVVTETESWTLDFLTWFWGVDALTNMCCVYFSMAFAKEHYMKVCADCCKCHQCCLWCIMKLINYQVTKRRTEKEKVVSQTQHTKADSDLDITDVAPQSNVISSPSSPSCDAV